MYIVAYIVLYLDDIRYNKCQQLVTNKSCHVWNTDLSMDQVHKLGILIKLSTYELLLKPVATLDNNTRTYTLWVTHNSRELIFIPSVSRIMLSYFIQLINHGWTLSPLLGSGGGVNTPENKSQTSRSRSIWKKDFLISIHVTLTRAKRPPIVALDAVLILLC